MHTTVGQRAGQAIRLASRGLWDASTDRRALLSCCASSADSLLTADSFVSETFESETLFASAQVFAVYYE